MGFREGVNKFIAGLALGGAIAGAPSETEATIRRPSVEASLEAARELRERIARTVRLEQSTMNDILFQTGTIDGMLVFVDESGERRYVVDGDGNELFPTEQSGVFEISVNDTRYIVSELRSINGTIYAIPTGFQRIQEGGVEVLVPALDTALPAVKMIVSPDFQSGAYFTQHNGTYLYARKDTGAPVQLFDSTGAELFSDEHGQFTMQFRGETVRVSSLTEYNGNVYAVPEGYVLDIVEEEEPVIRTLEEQEEQRIRRNNHDFTQENTSIGPTASK
jgi:hypothetical protein